jgi:hypothetical protein
MEAAAPPPGEVVAMLRQHRDALLALFDHDAAEADAMAEHYAAPVSVSDNHSSWLRPHGPSGPDRLAAGLLIAAQAHPRSTRGKPPMRKRPDVAGQP